MIAGTEFEQVVFDDFAEWVIAKGARPHDVGDRSAKHGEAVQCSFRAQFLRDPDNGVHSEDHPEESVLRRPDESHNDEQRPENRVEAGEQIRAGFATTTCSDVRRWC